MKKSENSGLKFNIQKMKIMVSGPITSWQTDRETTEMAGDFIFGEGEVAQPCPTLCDPWTVAHQSSLSMGFSRQEYWSGLPFPSKITADGDCSHEIKRAYSLEEKL